MLADAHGARVGAMPACGPVAWKGLAGPTLEKAPAHHPKYEDKTLHHQDAQHGRRTQKEITDQIHMPPLHRDCHSIKCPLKPELKPTQMINGGRCPAGPARKGNL